MALKDFSIKGKKVFDTPAKYGASPNDIEDYVSGKTSSLDTSYKPREKGLLTNLSTLGSALLDPWAKLYDVDNNFLNEQNARNMQEEAANLEFLKYVASKNNITPTFSVDPNGKLTPVTMADGSFPPAGAHILNPYTTTPLEQRNELTAKLDAKKDLNRVLPGVAATLQGFDDLDRYASKLPDFKSGVLGQAYAKGKSALGKFSADKPFTDYSAALSKSRSPVARTVMQEVGNLSTSDVETAMEALGQTNLPLSNKRENISNLRNQLIVGLEARLKSAGLDWEYLKEQNPGLYNKIFPESDSKTSDSNAASSGKSKSFSHLWEE